MIEETLVAHLKANVTLVSSRVYPLIMPQDCEKPALVYTVVNDSDNQALEGCVSSNEVRFQVDVYAESYASAKAVLTEVKSALYSFDLYPLDLSSRDGFGEDQELFRQIIDFTVRSS